MKHLKTFDQKLNEAMDITSVFKSMENDFEVTQDLAKHGYGKGDIEYEIQEAIAKLLDTPLDDILITGHESADSEKINYIEEWLKTQPAIETLDDEWVEQLDLNYQMDLGGEITLHETPYGGVVLQIHEGGTNIYMNTRTQKNLMNAVEL